ncbi:MAG TPA: EAL domain-containing protein [Bryobacteraceae bacterium]|nr:EAL domain-containing protein [Bryobacteraceae bacterium]
MGSLAHVAPDESGSRLYSSWISLNGQSRTIAPAQTFRDEFGWTEQEQAAHGFWLGVLSEGERELYLDAVGKAVREGFATVSYSLLDAWGAWHPAYEVLVLESAAPVASRGVVGILVSGAGSVTGMLRFKEEVWGAWACAGEDFFVEVLAALTASTQADFGFVGEIVDSAEGPAVRSFAVRKAGKPAENFVELVRGTPGEQVLLGQVRYYPAGVQTLFPRDRWLTRENMQAYYGIPLRDAAGVPKGLLVLMFHEPQPDVERLTGLVELVVSRASVEFDRLLAQRKRVESEERFRQIAETIQDGFWVMDALQNRLTYASPSFERIWNSSASERPEGAPWRELISAQADLLREIPLTREFQIAAEDGSPRWIRDRSFPVMDAAGECERVIGVSRDVTDEKMSLEALWESQQFVLTVANALPALLYLWDLEEGRLSLMNQYSRDMFHIELEQETARDLNPVEAIHPSDLVKLRVLRRQLAGSESGVSITTSFRLRQGDGGYRWFSGRETVFQRGISGAAKQILGVAHDISENIRLEQELLHSALHDRQTSLPNRILFEERLEQAARRAQREPGQVLAVLLLDLDRFQRVNDGLGHKAGDTVLVALARRLELCVREGDTVARFGSDEFGVLIEGLQTPGEAHLVAARLLATVSQPVDGLPQPVHLSASLGISLSGAAGADPREMMREAEMALSSAKQSGRGTFRVFDAAEHRGTEGRLRLESELRAAIQHNQFELLYQPICELSTGSVAGFECLLRWRHPERGLLSPGDFLDEAWEAGLMDPVSDWVLKTACARLAEWRQMNSGIYLSINIDGRQFAQPDFAGHIAVQLRDAQLPPGALHLEITETAISSNLEEAAALLRRLKMLGTAIMLDDFGIGFSSLSRLSRLPIDALKMDRSFLESLGTNTSDPVVLRAMLTLARDLNMRTIVEGVETAEQAHMLREAGCQYAQGFYLYQPLDQDEAVRLLLRQPAPFC